MSVLTAIGGLLLGAIVVVLVMCCGWEAATVRLQPRERRMWETAPPSGLSDDDVKVLEKLHDEADAARKEKAKGAASSVPPRNGNSAVAPPAAAGRRYTNESPGGRAPAVNPYTYTEDDVVAFNSASPGQVRFM
ncbi:hypothetical protein ABB37_09930 [Leptomonas pyrrhocoris]|uniref:Uncharacterized protein n=1 Tax=Leptomonas pyrrhocoris TaxID=157538 RepID=A0A0N0DQZ4_LEPPY|nr:hypothetical protein ABB37_09930 [Leptomonas pyrrhocoris]KPA73381.1 hypothetical protein ABB37_09930 [Leptomonas pyrrhocoris]|eukprot:XP_015651820.1 hypothetical protein ABB37_09930 [Leptomonas pyrrhocoris]